MLSEAMKQTLDTYVRSQIGVDYLARVRIWIAPYKVL